MIEMFFGLFLICAQTDPGQCTHVIGPLFDTESECIADMGSNGLNYLITTYGEDIHIASMLCIEATMQGNPA